MPLSIANATLLIIDVQQGFDDPFWGRRNNPQAETNIARLLAIWRDLHWPIIHVQHLSRLPNSPLSPNNKTGSDFKEVVRPLPGETIITKHVNSAFIDTPLEALLHEQQATTLVIVGLTTNHCVETTTRMAGNLGFTVYLVADATATFDRVGPDGILYRAEEIQAISLASLHDEFAQVVSTETLLNAADYTLPHV